MALRDIRKRARFETDMDAEVRGHIQDYAQDLMRAGVEPGEALRRARMEFGSMERVKEECREARGLGWADECARNLRYAARMLRKSPGFTAMAVLTLALCIGANTAIFSVVDAVVLRPLPYPEPERLASVVTFARARGVEHTWGGQKGATWEMVRDHAGYLDAAVYSWTKGVNFAAGAQAEYVQQHRVSAGYFRVFGVAPILGREFSREEDRPGGPPVTILSYALWRRAFHGDPAAVGRKVTLRGEPYTIAGVMPEGFRIPEPADLWTPLQASPTGEGAGENFGIVARLKPGVTWAQADAQVEAIGTEAVKDLLRNLPGASARLMLMPFQQDLNRGLRRPLFILWAAVGLVLLIGCANIAGLLLARAARRTREIATRMALGGGRGAVLRQLLTESLLLAAPGGAAGTLLGYLGMRGFVLLAQDSLGIWQAVRLDSGVLAATAGLSVITSVVFGLLPALHASRMDVRAGLAEGGGRSVAGASSSWPRRLLIVGEVALGVVLLIGAGLLLRSFAYLRGLRPGFDPSHVITASLSLQDARYNSSLRVERLFEDNLERIRRLPGVEAAAIGLSLPYQRPLNMGCRRVDGPGVDGKPEITNLTYVTPDYFRALRIPVLRGRTFRAGDARNAAPVAAVNEAFVKARLPNQDPIGSHIAFGDLDGRRPREIIGVVGDVQQRPGWGEYGPLSPMPGVFIPVSQTSDQLLQLVHTWFSPSWVVRSSGPQGSVIAGIERAVETIDPMLPFAGFRTMDEVRAQALAEQRTQAIRWARPPRAPCARWRCPGSRWRAPGWAWDASSAVSRARCSGARCGASAPRMQRRSPACRSGCWPWRRSPVSFRRCGSRG